ncbi:MAG: DNA adenine methylase [Actinomycetota bacterium]|nr:DNA adenine methylase [Actinomycetota bacterium]
MKRVLRHPGSKWNIASWIVAHLPEHDHYVEPFFGSGAVFFTKQPSHVETINDLNGDVVNFFKVVRELPHELADLVMFTPWSRDEYYTSYEKSGNALEDARRFLVRCDQAYGPRLNCRSGWRNDVQGRQNTSCARVWMKLPDRILEAAARLKNAQIENRPALEVIERVAYENVLIYADPPYMLDTRHGPLYKDEMADDDHQVLLEALRAHPGPVILSGYTNGFYEEVLAGWATRRARALAEGGQEREEVIWINPVAIEKLRGTLFWEAE